MDDFETEQNKQAAIRALSNYSEFAMVCIGEGVTPHQLRLHLMKEISGMPTSLEDHKVPFARKGEGASSSSQATSSTQVKPSKQSAVLEQLEKMRASSQATSRAEVKPSRTSSLSERATMASFKN